MELAVLNNSIPIKAIPEEKLNEIILTTFIDWLSGLLSLSGETSSERLKFALPAIKEHCWSMGFDEIKKMFEMYADNKLSIEPIPNYFDRVLFGKIVHAYKQQKPMKKKEIKIPVLSQEEKNDLIYTGCINCFDSWVQNGEVINGYAWVHDHLMDLNLLKFSKQQKHIMWKQAKTNLLEKSKGVSYEVAKDILRELERKQTGRREVEYKLIRLNHFFEKLHAKGKHIKDLI